MEMVATTADGDAQPLFQLPHVLVELTTQVGQTRIVGRLELEFESGGLRGQIKSRSGRARTIGEAPAQRVRQRFGDQHIGETADQ